MKHSTFYQKVEEDRKDRQQKRNVSDTMKAVLRSWMYMPVRQGFSHVTVSRNKLQLDLEVFHFTFISREEN